MNEEFTVPLLSEFKKLCVFKRAPLCTICIPQGDTMSSSSEFAKSSFCNTKLSQPAKHPKAAFTLVWSSHYSQSKLLMHFLCGASGGRRIQIAHKKPYSIF